MPLQVLVGLCLFLLPAAVFAAITNKVQAELEGKELVRAILELTPAGNLTNHGTLRVFQGKKKSDTALTFQIVVTETNWLAIYKTRPVDAAAATTLTITHNPAGPNQYSLGTNENFCGDKAMVPFARSDYWLSDLGLEFLHWPEQKVLKHELKRSQACKKLESTHPNPPSHGYSRVVSWIDNDTLGIVQAEAYDARGRRLKEFEPKDLRKVNGQYQVGRMDIRNVQTGSQTQLLFEFD